MERFGASGLDDLIEGLYLEKYRFQPQDALLVFRVAAEGDDAALEVVAAAGKELGQMACGAIRQVGIENEDFEVVQIGSLHDGHPRLAETMLETIHELAPGARLVRLAVPPVVGGALLGIQQAGLDWLPVRPHLLATTQKLMTQNHPKEVSHANT
jgi:N-acetylglucosamine kinase-like BadF-type ATPase